jgi:ribosomal protein S18 acetylase RimI-like enzyme
MLSGRDDFAVLWDIRIADGYKNQGIGQTLFDMAAYYNEPEIRHEAQLIWYLDL